MFLLMNLEYFFKKYNKTMLAIHLASSYVTFLSKTEYPRCIDERWQTYYILMNDYKMYLFS